MSEVWNNVSVYGPPPLIIQFKEQCIRPDKDEIFSHQYGWDGCDCTISLPGIPLSSHVSSCARLYVENFQHLEANTITEYKFSFDTLSSFPEKLFKGLAEAFPALAFDCLCHHSMDEFMGYGWFNPPPGGEEFQQNFRVPKHYWTTGPGYKRSKASQAKHEGRIARIIEDALRDVQC